MTSLDKLLYEASQGVFPTIEGSANLDEQIDGVTLVKDADGKLKVSDDFVGNGVELPINISDVTDLQTTLDEKAIQSDLNTLAQDVLDNKTGITSITTDITTLGQRVNDLENDAVESSDIAFDNTDTGLVSTNVQDVIKEVNVKVDDLDVDFDNYDTQLTNINGRLDSVELGNASQDIKITDLEAKDMSIENEINLVKGEYYKIKASASDMTADYLDNKVDGLTVKVENDKLVVKNIEGLTIGVADINTWLSGTTSNVQTQLDTLQTTIENVTTGMSYDRTVNTHADLMTLSAPLNGALVVVLADETHDNARSLYVYSDTSNNFEFVGDFTFSDKFLELEDTPSSFVGENNKVVKVDETNGKLVFANVDWSELNNKPTSAITDIDDAVVKKHEHANKVVIDKFSESTDGKLLYDGKQIEGTGGTGGGRDFSTNPLNLITESTAILPLNRYVKPKAEDIQVTDVNNNFTSTNIEGVLAELFTFADSGKKQISSAIGAPLTASDTFIQMRDKIVQLKTLLAEAITEHGVPTYPQNTLNEMIDKLKLVSRITLEGDIVKLSNIKITAPTQYKVELTNRLNISDVLLTVREVKEGQDNYTHFELSFEGSDVALFEANPNIIFDGELTLAPETIEMHVMEKDDTWSDTGFVSTYLVARDEDALNKIAILFNDTPTNTTLVLHENAYKYYDSATNTWTTTQMPISSQTFQDHGMNIYSTLERKYADVELGDMDLVESVDGLNKYAKNVDLNLYKDVTKVQVEDATIGKLLLESEDKTYTVSSEVVRHETRMTSNFLPAPLTVSASSYFSAIYPPWKAFNGTNVDVSDCWATVQGTVTGYLQIDFGAKKRVNKLSLTTRNYPAGGTDAIISFPRNFSVEGSDDGQVFTTIQTFTSARPTGSNQRFDFYMPESNYRMYRIVITTNHGNTLYTCFGEALYAYETTSFVEIPNSSVSNLNKYGMNGVIDGLNNPALAKGYVLQDENSRDTDGLMRVKTNSKISSIIFRREQ